MRQHFSERWHSPKSHFFKRLVFNVLSETEHFYS
nr:MAG TPA: REGULATORY PROTEIN MNT, TRANSCRIPTIONAL CONTROL, P22 MNT [Caudoviricetes sp.]